MGGAVRGGEKTAARRGMRRLTAGSSLAQTTLIVSSKVYVLAALVICLSEVRGYFSRVWYRKA